jgi:hypothetical protein
MKTIKKTASYILYTLLLAAVVCACTDRIDITKNYAFDLQIMPYPKRIVQGETIEIRARIVTDGNYAENQFFIRYFQNDGKGELKLDDGRVLIPNDLYLLSNTVFRLYYTSHSTDQQNLDIFIENSFGKFIQRSFSFSNEREEE